MKTLFISTLLIIFSSVYSQNITFLEKGDTLQKPDYRQFVYIAESTDLSNSKFLAKIKITGSIKNISELFDHLKFEGHKLGANSFKFESFNKIDLQNGELILSVYQNDDAFFELNFKNLPKNKIYIFGDQDLTKEKYQSYKVKSEKFEIETGKYKEFEIKIGEEIKINKGGFTGMTLWITRKENGYCSFLSFSGIGIAGASYNPRGGMGINISTGAIDKIEPNLALILLKIYSKQK